MKYAKYVRALLSLAAICLAAPALAQEWTRFRGPNGTGISEAASIPVQFTESEVNWRVKLPGAGHSSPVLWGSRIFLTTADGAAGKRHVLCLDAADGRVLWDRAYDFPRYPKHQLNSFASGSCCVDADYVYVPMATPDSVNLWAFDHNGKEIWKRELGKFQVNHGPAGSPIVIDDVVVMANDQEGGESFLAGVERATGRVLWRRERTSSDAGAFATPLVYRPKSGPAEVIFSSTSHGMTSLDPRTGELNWEAPALFTARCVASPVLFGDLVIQTAGTGGGPKQGVAVQPGSKKEGVAPKVAYRLTRDVSYVPTPIVYGEYLFLWGDAGIINCLKAATGERVWMERVGGNFFGSPVCVNGKLYAISAEGELVVVEAGGQFKVLGKTPLGEASKATPAVAGGVMYLRTESQLISVGGAKKRASR